MKKKTLNRIYLVVTILGIIPIIIGVLNLFGIDNINLKDIFKEDSSLEPKISIEPSSIIQGQYEKITFNFILENVIKNNITELYLSQDDVIVNRKNTNGQTAICKIIEWKSGYNNENVFFVNRKLNLGYSDKLEATAELYGGQNCFMGTNSPYVVTIFLQYRNGDGDLKPLTQEIEIPIV